LDLCYLYLSKLFFMKFDLIKTDSKSSARAGVINTDHGNIETPIFMPVGTIGSVKGVHQRELKMI